MDIDTDYKKVGSASLLEETELIDRNTSVIQSFAKSGVELDEEEETENDGEKVPEKVVNFHKLLDEYKARAENKLAYTI